MPARCTEIISACAGSDNAAVVTLAHTLKSSSATVGAAALRSLFVDLESAARTGDRNAMERQANRLTVELKRYREAVQGFIR